MIGKARCQNSHEPRQTNHINLIWNQTVLDFRFKGGAIPGIGFVINHLTGNTKAFGLLNNPSIGLVCHD